MKKIYTLVFLAFCLFIGGCSSDNEEEERISLKEKYQEIINLSTSVSCEDATEWKIASVTENHCNTPIFIAYSVKIDEKQLLKLMNEYVSMYDKYAKKWGLECTAIGIPIPSGVECKDGKPVFVYEDKVPLPSEN